MNYFDLHCDSIEKLSKNPFSKTAAIRNVKDFETHRQCFALFVDDSFKGQKAAQRAERLFQTFERRRRKIEKRSIIPYLTLENCEVFAENLAEIEKWKKRRAICATLTWNGENSLACGSSCKSGGLKRFGIEAVKKMNDCSITCDLSHINDEGFFDFCRLFDFPFVATHSCCRAVCENKRNLTDSQIKEIILRNGLVGLAFYPPFLGDGCVFEKIYRHIYHILELGGENTVAIGSDFDGAKMKRELKNSASVPDLCDFLLSKGLAEPTVEKIMSKNAEKFFAGVLQT